MAGVEPDDQNLAAWTVDTDAQGGAVDAELAKMKAELGQGGEAPKQIEGEKTESESGTQ